MYIRLNDWLPSPPEGQYDVQPITVCQDVISMFCPGKNELYHTVRVNQLWLCGTSFDVG